MKPESEEKIAEFNQRKAPPVVINLALEKDKDVVYFPEKLEQANEMLKTARLPERMDMGWVRMDIEDQRMVIEKGSFSYNPTVLFKDAARIRKMKIIRE